MGHGDESVFARPSGESGERWMGHRGARQRYNMPVGEHPVKQMATVAAKKALCIRALSTFHLNGRLDSSISPDVPVNGTHNAIA